MNARYSLPRTPRPRHSGRSCWLTDRTKSALQGLTSGVPCDWAAALAAHHITTKPARFSTSSGDAQLLSVVAEIAAAAVWAEAGSPFRATRRPVRRPSNGAPLQWVRGPDAPAHPYSRSAHAFDERAIAQGSVRPRDRTSLQGDVAGSFSVGDLSGLPSTAVK
jgi:hypothetical protein